MDLTNLPEYISAIVAIIALLISCYQARLSNKQSNQSTFKYMDNRR